MSFASELVKAANPERRCKTREWIDRLEDADADAFNTYAQAVQLKDLHTLMCSNGFEYGRDTVSRHLKGECICDLRG